VRRYDVANEKKPASSSLLHRFLVEAFPEDLIAWLLHEMAENRTEAVKGKVYSQTEMHHSASNQGPFQTNWGSKGLISKISSCPDLLMPQAASGVRT
jgi:hypothetical protein